MLPKKTTSLTPQQWTPSSRGSGGLVTSSSIVLRVPVARRGSRTTTLGPSCAVTWRRLIFYSRISYCTGVFGSHSRGSVSTAQKSVPWSSSNGPVIARIGEILELFVSWVGFGSLLRDLMGACTGWWQSSGSTRECELINLGKLLA